MLGGMLRCECECQDCPGNIPSDCRVPSPAARQDCVQVVYDRSVTTVPERETELRTSPPFHSLATRLAAIIEIGYHER